MILLGKIIIRNNCSYAGMRSKARSYSILEKHKDFIDLVKDHGTGDITCSVKESNIRIIEISNPAERNAISGRMMLQLGQIIDSTFHQRKASDPELKGILITGSNKFFCSGASLQLATERINTPEKGRMMAEYMTEALNTIRDSGVVSVTAINGPALGGGAEFATCTDYRIIKSDAYIQFVHATIGAAPGWGGIQRLVSIVGRNKALQLLGTGHKVSPEEAKYLELANDIFDEDAESSSDLSQKGIEWLNTFYGRSYSGSISAIKNVIVSCDKGLTHTEIAKLEAEAFQSRWFCDDNKLAIENFFKRKDKKRN